MSVDRIASSTCPQCQATVNCGAVSGAATCWCAQLPPLTHAAQARLKMSNAAGCLCPACLSSLIVNTTVPNPENHPSPE